MRPSRIPAVFFLLGLLLPALLLAAEPWKNKPYTKWTPEEVRKVMEDSPWAYRVLRIEMPPPDAGRPREDDRARGRMGDYTSAVPTYTPPPPVWRAESLLFIVQWRSSLTMRQAVVRWAELAGRGSEEEAARFLSTPSEEYVLVLYGPAMPALNDLSEEALQASAYLQAEPGMRKVSPTQVKLLREGTNLILAEFHFSRKAAGADILGPGDSKVRFSCPTASGAMEAKFDLRKMVRDAKPDL